MSELGVCKWDFVGMLCWAVGGATARACTHMSVGTLYLGVTKETLKRGASVLLVSQT